MFNEKPQPPGNYRFELFPQGLELTPRPIIDIGFRDFTAEAERWRLANNFVTIDLPSPKTISFYGQPDLVVFASPPGGGRTGRMPSNHILEYQVEDPKAIKMRCAGLKDPCEPSPKSDSQVTRFSFAVGLPPHKDQNGQHAVKFFNYLLCGFFPELVKNYSIAYVREGTDNPAGTRGAISDAPQGRLVPTVLKYEGSRPHLLLVTQIVDCLSGGIIVTTDKPPTGG
jgi:hypothetical protein